VDKHHMPAAVAGFTPVSLLAAFYSVLRQLHEGKFFLDNCYPEAVRPGGNAAAQKQLQQALHVVDANWRGIGVIPASGYALNAQFAAHDARIKFADYNAAARKHAGQMPPGCDCARVVLGKIYPNECKLYGAACTPRTPIGHAWCRTKVPAVSGGAAGCANQPPRWRQAEAASCRAPSVFPVRRGWWG